MEQELPFRDKVISLMKSQERKMIGSDEQGYLDHSLATYLLDCLSGFDYVVMYTKFSCNSKFKNSFKD